MTGVLSQEFTRASFLHSLLDRHAESRSRAEVARKRKRLLAQREALNAKRSRVIEFALEGTISKPDRDRRLKLVDDDLAVNEQALAALVETPMPTFEEWKELMRPFRRGFSGLPIEQKRKLVAERFQEIKIRDGRVVSLYLLTGQTKAVADNPTLTHAPEESNCHTCGRTLTADDLDYNVECGVDTDWRFCTSCLDCTPKERAGRQYRVYGYDPIQRVSPFSDTSQGL